LVYDASTLGKKNGEADMLEIFGNAELTLDQKIEIAMQKFTSGSSCNAIIKLDSIVVSNMGVSYKPVANKICVTSARYDNSNTVDDLVDDD